jgi:phage N-6-adenine-methyltransferase
MLCGFKAQNHQQQLFARGGPVRDVDDRGTEPGLFEQLHARFNFSIDVAAASHNAKLPKFFDIASDGLSQSWAGECVWCNPPYSDIAPWMIKAWAEYPTTRGIVMLLPANRTEQAWWQDHIEATRDRDGQPLKVEFLRHRRRFIRAGSTSIGPNERPPFGVCLAIWQPSA